MIFHFDETQAGSMELHAAGEPLARAKRLHRRRWKRNIAFRGWVITDPLGEIPYLTSCTKRAARGLMVEMAFRTLRRRG